MVNNECKMVILKETYLRRRLLAFYLADVTFSWDLLEGRGFRPALPALESEQKSV